jgi:DNA polymerase-4
MARIGYVLIEHFAVAVERQRRPDLEGRPLIVGGYPYERKTVYEASSEALAAGVRPAMPLRQAEQLCPDAVFLPLAEAHYAKVAEGLLAAVESFSPAVEPDALGSAYFDARGLALLFGADDRLARHIVKEVAQRLGLSPRIGIGPTRLTARLAARLSEPGEPRIINEHPADFLAALPVAHLPGNGAFHDQLRLLGIRTIGQFMALPFSELTEQFGPLAVAAYNRCYGRGDPPLLPRPRPAALRRRREIEPPSAEVAVLSRAIEALSVPLAGALRRRYQACQTIVLRLELVGGETVEETAQLKAPLADAGAIAAAARRLGERIRQAPETRGREGDGFAFASQVAAIQLIATGLTGQGGRQLGLFDAQRQRRIYLEQAANEVRRRFGDRLKRAERGQPGGIAAPPFILRDYFE